VLRGRAEECDAALCLSCCDGWRERGGASYRGEKGANREPGSITTASSYYTRNAMVVVPNVTRRRA
jgi:hypothetical protein